MIPKMAALSFGLLALTTSLLAQNYGSQFYSYTNFPGGNWPAVPVPATSISIGNPTGITTDVVGNVYIAGPSIIFKLDPAGMLTRIAGDGHNGYSGDGGPATDAQVGFPLAVPYDQIDWGDAVGSLAADAAGNLYIADMFNNRVRKISPDGVISTIAGNGDSAPFDTRDNDGGRATDARLWLPMGIAAGSAGRLYIADGTTVRQITPDGVIRSLTPNDCGRHKLPGVCAPEGVAVDGSGNAYVADGYCRIRRISPDGDITTVAGDERPSCCSFAFTCGYSGDNGPATSAGLGWPYGVAVDPIGNLYIADTYSHRIRKVSPDGTITTIAGGSGPSPYGTIRRGYAGDGGPATNALLNLPHAVAVDGAGNVYIADTGNYVIRKVSPDGNISTVAGNGVWCCSR